MKRCKWIIGIAAIFSLIAILISLIVLCRHVPRYSELNLDYLGVIIGILSLLVTFLLGWNIYTVLEVKEERKIYKEELEKCKKQTSNLEKKLLNDMGEMLIERNEIFASIHKDFAKISIDLFCDKRNETQMYAIAKHLIQAIICYQYVGSFKQADELIDSFCKLVIFKTLKDEHREKIIESAKMIKRPERLKNYDALMKTIYSQSAQPQDENSKN